MKNIKSTFILMLALVAMAAFTAPTYACDGSDGWDKKSVAASE